MKGGKIIAGEKSELMEFAEEYIQSHAYINSRSMAREYEGINNRGQPSLSLTYRFAQVLRKLIEKGLIEKYNNRQYKKIGMDV